MEFVEPIINLFTEHISWSLVAIILFSSQLMKNLSKNWKIDTAIAVFVFSTLVAMIYSWIQHLIGNLPKEAYSDYLISYFFATSFYELLLKHIIKLFNKKPNE